jgi:hypothetical protein
LKRKWVEVESSDEPDSPVKPVAMQDAEILRLELGGKDGDSPHFCTREEQGTMGARAFAKKY